MSVDDPGTGDEYQCDICGRTFDTRAELREHIRDGHETQV